MSKNVRRYVAPDGKEFKMRKNAVRYMNDNNLPGSLTVVITNPKTEPKKQEIYFLPIFGLRLVAESLIEMPESMLKNENSAMYENVRNYYKNMVEILIVV